MQIISAAEARQNFSVLLESAAREPVLIKRHHRNIAVLLSPHLFELLCQRRIQDQQFQDQQFQDEQFQDERIQYQRFQNERFHDPQIHERLNHAHQTVPSPSARSPFPVDEILLCPEI